MIGNKNFDSLKNFNEHHQRHYEALIVFEQQLDFGTNREFEKKRESDELPSVNDFIDFLKTKS